MRSLECIPPPPSSAPPATPQIYPYLSISIIHIKIYRQLTTPDLVFAMVRSRALFDAVSRMYSAEFFSPSDTLHLYISISIDIIHMNIYSQLTTPVLVSAMVRSRSLFDANVFLCIYIHLSIYIAHHSRLRLCHTYIYIRIVLYLQLTTPVLVSAMVRSRSLFDAVSRMYSAESFSPSDTLHLSISAHIHIHIYIYIYIYSSPLQTWSSPWCDEGRTLPRMYSSVSISISLYI